ncbi:5-oxoprolinase subunit PxpB [Paraburkholderia lacunae]|uniref:Allophanate hydrolase n=1 Tax=Paraburkholderia lacunae TaxID=2211104 RepID=A0A370NB98_9BURK|nr:5-oxoprolinase subunit PxpB [Paraburkholderia lacunae]RDK02877.1 allophanate hydrolase [Paraburkholderia lacunae]
MKSEPVLPEAVPENSWSLFPSGESLLIIEVAGSDRVEQNRRARAFAARVAAAQLDFVIDIAPAMTTVGIHYAPSRVPLPHETHAPYDALAKVVAGLLESASEAQPESARVVEIPVCYGGEHGPDLEEVARSCGLATGEIIALHSDSLVDVMLLGFAPGHPYIGMFDKRLSPARRATPRTAVAPGSIGLANRQTVIYPMALPGGWNLIGRTPCRMFDPSRETPCLMNAGDRIRFMPITPEQFQAYESASRYAGAAR